MLPSTAQSIGQKNQLGLLNRAPLCNESLLFIAPRNARTAFVSVAKGRCPEEPE